MRNSSVYIDIFSKYKLPRYLWNSTSGTFSSGEICYID